MFTNQWDVPICSWLTMWRCGGFQVVTLQTRWSLLEHNLCLDNCTTKFEKPILVDISQTWLLHNPSLRNINNNPSLDDCWNKLKPHIQTVCWYFPKKSLVKYRSNAEKAEVDTLVSPATPRWLSIKTLKFCGSSLKFKKFLWFQSTYLFEPQKKVTMRLTAAPMGVGLPKLGSKGCGETQLHVSGEGSGQVPWPIQMALILW